MIALQFSSLRISDTSKLCCLRELMTLSFWSVIIPLSISFDEFRQSFVRSSIIDTMTFARIFAATISNFGLYRKLSLHRR